MSKKIFFLLLILTPGFWFTFLQPQKVFTELSKSPKYFETKINSMFSTERMTNLNTLKEIGGERSLVNIVMPEIFYNRISILVDEFFSYTSFITPRFYFQAGDGGKLSPPNTEPIAAILFPMWLFGIVVLIKKKKFLIIYLLFGFALLAFMFGQRDMAFLWPVLIINLYISQAGIFSINNIKLRNFYFLIFLIYGLFIDVRSIYMLTR